MRSRDLPVTALTASRAWSSKSLKLNWKPPIPTRSMLIRASKPCLNPAARRGCTLARLTLERFDRGQRFFDVLAPVEIVVDHDDPAVLRNHVGCALGHLRVLGPGDIIGFRGLLGCGRNREGIAALLD